MRRFNTLACGRRWGKTRLGAALCLETALLGGRAWWVAPSYKMGQVGWRLIRSLSAQIPGARRSEVDRIVEFVSGGSVQVRSADDPDSLRGEGLDFLVMDECAFTKESAWSEALRPSLTDRKGRALFISTPKGRNWFWRLYNTTGEEYAHHSYPTSSNPYIDPAEIQAAKETVPERIFRQEYLAEFIEDAGSVFRNVSKLSTLKPLEKAKEGRQYFAGVDWGKHNDFTVVSVFDDLGDQVYLDRFNKVDYVVQIGRISAINKRFGLTAILAESNSIGEPNIERMVREGLPVEGFATTNRSKAAAVEAFEAALDHEEMRLIDDETQTAELQALEQTRLPSGLTRYAAPEGMHDDIVMADILAWRARGGKHWLFSE